ncbi:MAG: hypothetical protein GY739_09770 [Mesoflavibacter sp.]|nr:hypothetical protein [Mesoflavibacter sp.]
MKNEDVKIYTGEKGSTFENATKRIRNKSVSGVLTQNLKPYEGLTVVNHPPKISDILC